MTLRKNCWKPNYMWQDFLTREQFATVLFRYAKALGIA